MTATTFWSADGRPMSAAQFVENLFGELPAFFKDEDELRLIRSRPDTRKALLQGLSEKGFGPSQLGEIRGLIEAENSDIFDVLGYVAFTQCVCQVSAAFESPCKAPILSVKSLR